MRARVAKYPPRPTFHTASEEEFSEVRCSNLPRPGGALGDRRGSGRGYAGFLSIIVDTLAAFVAWICCERLRVATCRLRENFRNRHQFSTGGIFMRDRGDPGDRQFDDGKRIPFPGDAPRDNFRLWCSANFAFWAFSEVALPALCVAPSLCGRNSYVEITGSWPCVHKTLSGAGRWNRANFALTEF
jgi:hypothetical protein